MPHKPPATNGQGAATRRSAPPAAAAVPPPRRSALSDQTTLATISAAGYDSVYHPGPSTSIYHKNITTPP